MNNLDQTESPLAGTPANPKITTNSGEGHPAWNDPVYFPEWHEILALAPLDAQTQARFAKAIIYYLGIAGTLVNERRSRVQSGISKPDPIAGQ